MSEVSSDQEYRSPLSITGGEGPGVRRPLSRPERCPVCEQICELVFAGGRWHLLDPGVRTLSHRQRVAAGTHECARRGNRQFRLPFPHREGVGG